MDPEYARIMRDARAATVTGVTDHDKLTALLTLWGVEYETRPSHASADLAVVEVHPGNRKVIGLGIAVLFYFERATGKFIEMGAWHERG